MSFLRPAGVVEQEGGVGVRIGGFQSDVVAENKWGMEGAMLPNPIQGFFGMLPRGFTRFRAG